jgi:broad specificity phosphatase PhoE
VTLLVLVRHAHTMSNMGSGTALSGRTDVALSRLGKSQVERLRSCSWSLAPLTAIYTSPLRRARETASALAADNIASVRVYPALQEIDCGTLDGLALEEVKCRYPDLWAANLKQEDDSFRWPGGESYRELRSRCVRAMRSIALAHPDERVALVTHAGVINQILGALQGIRPAHWECNRPGNASVTEIAWVRGAGKLLRFDDRSHLGALQEASRRA